jgi:hypothetical protein
VETAGELVIPIENHGPKISEPDVAALELRLGTTLPDQYRHFLLEFNGGSPAGTVEVPGLPGALADVQVLFGIGRAVRSSGIEWNMETLAQRLKPQMLPIACDSGGSVFCLALSTADRGAVFYCDLQSVFGKPASAPSMYLVAPDFDSFIGSLQPFS